MITETTETETKTTEKRPNEKIYALLKMTPAERIHQLELMCPNHAMSDRIALLAATYTLGRPYRTAEPTARPLEERKGEYGARLFRAALGAAAAALAGSQLDYREAVEAWMKEPEPEERRTRRLSHEAEREAVRKARWTANRELYASQTQAAAR